MFFDSLLCAGAGRAENFDFARRNFRKKPQNLTFAPLPPRGRNCEKRALRPARRLNSSAPLSPILRTLSPTNLHPGPPTKSPTSPDSPKSHFRQRKIPRNSQKSIRTYRSRPRNEISCEMASVKYFPLISTSNNQHKKCWSIFWGDTKIWKIENKISLDEFVVQIFTDLLNIDCPDKIRAFGSQKCDPEIPSSNFHQKSFFGKNRDL